MATAIDQVASETMLKAAWADVSRNRRNKPSYHREGVDKESLYSFSARLESNVAHLSSEIRKGDFRFGALQPAFVPKANGKDRLICIPAVRDRVVQRALLTFLRPKNGWMANGVSFGFVPDLSVTDALARARDLRRLKPWVFKTDITAFFDHMDRGILSDLLRRRMRHKTLLPLFEAAIRCEIEPANAAQKKKLLRDFSVQPGRGVRQGMPLSPYFANLMLEPFDRACVHAKMDAIRYADDLAFFVSSEDEALQAQAFCLAQLGALKLDIPVLADGSKTRIYRPEEPAEFLGQELAPTGRGDYELRVSAAQMARMKEQILTFGSLSELQLRGHDISRFGNALLASVRAYEAVYEDCANAKDVAAHLDNCRRVALERILVELGIKPRELTAKQAWFLGLQKAEGQRTSARIPR